MSTWQRFLDAGRTLGPSPGVREAWHQGRSSYAVWALHQRGLLRGFENLVPMGIMTGPSMVLFSTKPICT